MLFAPAVLSVLLITASAQEQECHLAKWLRALYIKFFSEYKERHPVPIGHQYLKWNKTMSDQAFQEAEVRGSVVKGHDETYIVLQHKKAFWKKDRLSVKEKVRKTLESHEFIQQAEYARIQRLGDNANFGCNGHGEEKDDKEYMNIVCFFEKFWGFPELGPGQ
ncbi:hypothetical protein GCK32_001759 [Trichostrongylus colubriformis]|uniref:Uncharacterized protein n=1 Tax=Trichostrongylus colubriformis TaxID=6319 RepID=A0AAN8F218_TRICO